MISETIRISRYIRRLRRDRCRSRSSIAASICGPGPRCVRGGADLARGRLARGTAPVGSLMPHLPVPRRDCRSSLPDLLAQARVRRVPRTWAMVRGCSMGTSTSRTIRPGRVPITMIRSPRVIASSMLCVMKTMVCRSRARRRQQVLLEHLADLGVHRRERLVHEQHVRRRWPGPGPARPAASCRRTAAPGTCARGRSGRRSRSRRRTRSRPRPARVLASCSGSATLRCTVFHGNRPKCWNTTATRRLGPGDRAHRRCRPARGRLRPARPSSAAAWSCRSRTAPRCTRTDRCRRSG